MTTNSPSRRGMLSAVAALSLTAVGTGAALAASAPTDDPIFEAIDDHRRAKQAFAKACADADNLEFPPTARIVIGHVKDGNWTKTDDEDGGYTLRWTPNGEEKPIYLTDACDLYRNAPKGLEGADRGAWMTARKAELEREKKRVAAEWAQTEQGKLDAIREEADDAEYSSVWNLIWTMPTTKAGLSALLAYVRENHGSQELAGEEWSDALDWTIEKAVCAFAGLPEPPMNGIVAALWDEVEEEAAA